MKKGISTILAVCTTVFVMLALGAGGWYVMNKQAEDYRSASEDKIAALNEQVAKLQKEAEVASTSTADSTTEDNSTAGWKTYTNTTHKFSIKYPSDFTVTAATDTPGANFAINPVNKSFQGNLFYLSIKLNVAEAMTLEDWVSQKNLGVKQGTATVGNSNGYRFLNDGTVSLYWSNSANDQVSGLSNSSGTMFNGGVITQAQKTNYDSIFELMKGTFQYN